MEPFDSSIKSRTHLVSIEYLDPDGAGDDNLIWEREPSTLLLEPTVLPDPVRDAPMAPAELDALIRATRWTALTPYVNTDDTAEFEQRLPLFRPYPV